MKGATAPEPANRRPQAQTSRKRRPTKGDLADEATPVSEICRTRIGRGSDRRSGRRAEHAGTQVAHDLELPEEPRHHLRRGRDLHELRCRGDRPQVSDPGFCRRRVGSRAGSRQRRRQWFGRTVPYGELLLLGQGPDLCLRHRRSVRSQHAYAERLDVPWRRHRSDERVLRDSESLRPCPAEIPARRWAAGSARRSSPSRTCKE